MSSIQPSPARQIEYSVMQCSVVCSKKKTSVGFCLPDWTCHKMEEKLILAVENHPVLYDKSLSNYKSGNSRDQAWKEVAKEINFQGK